MNHENRSPVHVSRVPVQTSEVRSGIQRLRVLDTPVDAIDMETALSVVDRCVRLNSAPVPVLAVNPEKVYALRKDQRLKDFVESAGLLLPDGIGMVAAARMLYSANLSRTPGADLMQNICAVAAGRGYRIFILGASEAVNESAVRRIEERYPGINVVGRQNGYFTAAENDEIVSRINKSGANILFVAMGSPRQEHWIEQNLSSLQVNVCQGIGGTLDTIVGKVKRAPKAWQSMGLEWAYRLIRQPSRAGRQLKLVSFVVELLYLKVSRVSG